MKRYRWIIGIGIALVVIVASAIYAGVMYAAHFVSTVNPTHTAAGLATACGTAVPSTGLSIFQIVSNQTTASYKVHENLILGGVGSNDAVGKTHSVQGSFHIRTGTSPLVAGMNITVDLSTLQTDQAQRDRHVYQDYLQTDTYPTATFVSTCAQGLPASYTDGQPVSFQLVGNLTLHGKTNKEVFDVQGMVAGKTITGTATSTIYMTDFGIQPPDLSNIAIAENKVLVTITFTAQES
jgi:polyisoprenoid-binding protein YceI